MNWPIFPELCRLADCHVLNVLIVEVSTSLICLRIRDLLSLQPKKMSFLSKLITFASLAVFAAGQTNFTGDIISGYPVITSLDLSRYPLEYHHTLLAPCR
jgi:hypothetical protein